MKFDDIQKIHGAGLISTEQRDKINAHFGLKEEGSKFLVIISFIGAVLVAAGITLLIGAHWNEIPKGVKIAAGLALMLGAHGTGWWLREDHGTYRKTGEAMQFIGSLLFLANIALIGQIYHLSSRTPNAFLLWTAGIAALPWILRSTAQFALLLVAFSIWFGCEINQRDSLIYLGNETQILGYALIGLNFLGLGLLLRWSKFPDFAPFAEKLGVFGLLLFSYPLTWAGFLSWGRYHDNELCRWLLPTLAGLGILLTALGVRQLPALTTQWRFTWAGALAGAAALLCLAFFAPVEREYHWFGHMDTLNSLAAVALFLFSLLQIQTGLQLRSEFLVNLGVAVIGLDMISMYFGLFGTMAVTGAMFVATGVFLIVFGVYLEKKRRKLMQQIKTPVLKEAL